MSLELRLKNWGAWTKKGVRPDGLPTTCVMCDGGGIDHRDDDDYVPVDAVLFVDDLDAVVIDSALMRLDMPLLDAVRVAYSSYPACARWPRYWVGEHERLAVAQRRLADWLK